MPQGFDDEMDFGDILASFEREQAAGGGARPAGAKAPAIGDQVSAEVLGFGDDVAFVELGAKSEGLVALDELRGEDGELSVAVGDSVTGVIAAADPETGSLVLRVRAGRGALGREVAVAELRQSFAGRLPVEGRVTGVNKGGVDVEVAGLRAFCPISQLDLGYVDDAGEHVGQRLTFRITRFSEGRGGHPDIVLSRRVLLAEEQAARAAEALARLAVGETVRGTVASLASYGAFVDLGGVEGLLHVSEISHQRVADPADVLAVGQALEVEVLRIEPAKEDGASARISLSLRALEPDPWHDVAARFPVGTVTSARVARLETFGAFAALAPGVDGLLHISELGELAGGRRINHPREVLAPDQEITVRVLAVDPEKRRIALASEVEGAEPAAVAELGTSSGGLGTLGDFFKTRD